MSRAALRAFADNRRMLMKLLVVVAVMFGFGYALVPMYRAICDALGINVLSLSEQRVATGNWSGAQRLPTPRSTRRVRSRSNSTPTRAGPGLQAGAALGAGAPGEMTTVMYEFKNIQNRTMAAQAIRATRRCSQRALQQARVLLLQRIHPGPGESRTWPVVFVVDPNCPGT